MTATQKISELHDRFYKNKKGTKKAKQEAKVKKVIQDKKAIKEAKQAEVKAPQPVCATKSTGVGIVDQAPKAPKAGSRAELMKQAQAKSIKYFRILSKEELQEILITNPTPSRITEIQEAAKKRWKAGWTKGAKKQPKNPLKESRTALSAELREKAEAVA